MKNCAASDKGSWSVQWRVSGAADLIDRLAAIEES